MTRSRPVRILLGFGALVLVWLLLTGLLDGHAWGAEPACTDVSVVTTPCTGALVPERQYKDMLQCVVVDRDASERQVRECHDQRKREQKRSDEFLLAAQKRADAEKRRADVYKRQLASAVLVRPATPWFERASWAGPFAAATSLGGVALGFGVADKRGDLLWVGGVTLVTSAVYTLIFALLVE